MSIAQNYIEEESRSSPSNISIVSNADYDEAVGKDSPCKPLKINSPNKRKSVWIYQNWIFSWVVFNISKIKLRFNETKFTSQGKDYHEEQQA